MASNTITVTYKVNEDGSLQKISAGAEKAAKSTKKASDATAQHNKQQKGVAGATANSTKGFSKMTTGMQGGLVPAYAEVAARVFALTAAFGVLSRNDAIAKLQEGIEFTGRAAGRNLTFVADKLQEITDNAISAEQAMRATAVGVSAGFSEEQMSGLAEVAKGASLALGRDMADAMDRLIRGAAKLEPEILDELGIMVRLDEASENYARTLNKTVGELTQFEKRMAFTNAIIEQGRQKFDGISEAIEASAFSKLSASLQDVAKGFIGILNKVLGPMANFLAENTLALGALVALYAGSVAGTILGGITSMAAASAKGAERTTAQSKAALKGIKPVKGLGNAFNVLAHKTDRSAKAMTGMNKSLTTTINHHNSSAKKVRLATKLRNQLTTEIHRADLAQAKHNFTNALGVLQEVGIAAGVRVHIQALRDLAIATGAAMAQQTAFYAVLTFGRGVMLAVSASLKFLGASFLVVMPYIGIFLAAVAILGPMLTSLFGMEDTRLEKAIKKNAERTEEFNKVLEQYNETIGKAKGATQLWANTLKPLSGLLSETSAAVSSTIAAARTQQILAEVAATTKLTDAIKAANDAKATNLKNVSQQGPGGFKSTAKSAAVIVAEEAVKDAKQVSEAVKALVKKDILNSMAAFQATTEGMAVRLNQLAAEGEPVQDALNAVAAGQAGVQKIMAEFDADLISADEASRQLIVLDTSTQAVVQSFESFADIINKAKDLTGDVTSTWGTYGKEIDNVAQGLINVNKILKDGKGITAANEKATDLLKAYGIDPTDNPVKKLAQFEAGLRLINGAYKELELKEANSALTNTSAIASGITLLQNLEARLSLTQQELVTKELIGSNTAAEHILLLQKLEIQKQITDELEKQAQKVADRATRLGGEVFGQSFAAAEGYADYSAENPDAKQSEKMAKLNELAQPQLQALSALSPEGALMSSAIEGALVLQEAFSMAFEDIGKGGDKMQIGLEVAAAGLSVISGMMAASSKAQVASIDKQIEAEKKRDGKSVASIAKIKAMEKKKEDIKRKAFETDKKLKMATVMISTASAVMKAVEESPLTGGMPFSGFAIAMGAAQLAAIASTSYQGGGSISDSAAPSSLSVGKRQNTVDLGKANNAGGELGYMRGESGQGKGATDFKPTPAFAGYKNRAGGGYIVGEQGPEVFMPDTAGSIIPSGQSTGGSTNVSFNIQAIDASGVEDVLIAQKGQIIRMIREAANEHGEFFLENVREEAYQQ